VRVLNSWGGETGDERLRAGPGPAANETELPQDEAARGARDDGNGTRIRPEWRSWSGARRIPTRCPGPTPSPGSPAGLADKLSRRPEGPSVTPTDA
jgi:hypothetical protein